MNAMSVKSNAESLREARERLREAERALDEIVDGPAVAEAAPEQEPATVRALAAESNVSEEAVRAFAQTAGELLAGEPLTPANARRAAMIAASEVAWERALGPLLSGLEVRELLGGISRQRVDELLRGKRLIGLRDRAGRRRYPLFQFADGRPVEQLIDAFYEVSGSGLDEWSAASWCTHPDPSLDGESPAQWAKTGRDPERLTRIARQDASRFAQ